MIKTITKHIFMCDMCGREYAGSRGEIVPKDVFEFTVNLAEGAKNVQICPKCQLKLRSALMDKLCKIYGATEFYFLAGEGEKNND